MKVLPLSQLLRSSLCLSRRAKSVPFGILALSPFFLTVEMAKAELLVNGMPANFTTNATNVYTLDNGDPTTQTLAGVGVVVADGSASGTGNFNASGSLSVQSGTYTLNASNTSFVGQGNRTGSATIDVSGGTLNINSPNNAFVVANSGGHAAVNVSGGVFNLSIGANQPLFVGRESGVAQFNITGGLFSTDTTNFVLDTQSAQQGGGPSPSGVITFGSGSGEFRFTNTPTTFDLGNSANSFINFVFGSGGLLEINGYAQSQFDALVTNGNIRIDGSIADPSAFAYSNVGGLGTYGLAAVPEPSTWAVMAAGVAGMSLVHRRRRTA